MMLYTVLPISITRLTSVIIIFLIVVNVSVAKIV